MHVISYRYLFLNYSFCMFICMLETLLFLSQMAGRLLLGRPIFFVNLVQVNLGGRDVGF